MNSERKSENEITIFEKLKTGARSNGVKIRKIFKGGITRKKIIVSCSVLLLGAAVYLNYYFFSAGNDADIESSESSLAGNSAFVASQSYDDVSDYFAMVELTRTRARDESMEVLQLVVDSDSAVAEAKDDAIAKMTSIAESIEDEANIESLVISKGFEDCIAVIDDGKINIVVKSSGLMPNEIAQIKEIVYEHSGIVPADVKIIEKN